MNAIMLVGHLPADARGSKTSDGNGYGLIFTVSVADYVRAEGGALIEKPMFFECAFVGKKAEIESANRVMYVYFTIFATLRRKLNEKYLT